MKVAVLKGGRSLERGVSLRSGARVEDALGRLGHEVVAARCRRMISSAAHRRSGPMSPSSPCTGRGARTGLAGAARDPRHPLHRPGRRRLRPMHGQGRSPSTTCARPGIPTPDWVAFNATAFRELGAGRRARARSRQRLGFPLVVKPAAGGSALGVEFAADARRGPRGPGRRVQLRRPGPARALRRRAGARGLRARTASALPIVEAIPREERPLRLRGPLRDRAHRLRLPGRPRRRGREAVTRRGARGPTRRSAARASRGST